MIDFVVVGGGMAGISAAAHLAPHGEVVLFEMESTLAYHTTGRSAAMLVENYGSPASRKLVKAGRPFLENPPPGTVDAPLLSPRPVMWVGRPDDAERLESIAAEGVSSGARNQILTSEEVVDRMPIMKSAWLGGGLLEPSGAEIDVASLHQAFVRIARSGGVEIATESPVTAIDRTTDGWIVTAGGATLETRAIINAAGAWGDVVARLASVAPIGLQPMRRTAFMVPGGTETSDLAMVVEVRENWYLKPDGVQFLCSLAEENPSDPMDAKPRMEDVALAIDRINEATTLGIRTVNSQWTGLRTFAPDRDLVIGEDPTSPGFYWLVGLGGIGIQTSPAYGSLLACLATGSELTPTLVDAGVDPEATSPARFR